MTIIYLLSALETLEQQYTILFLLIDLTLKSSIVLLLTFSLGLHFRKYSAADQSALWMVAIASLLLLPLFHFLLPSLPISLAIDESVFASLVMNGVGDVAFLFGNNNINPGALATWIVTGYVSISLLFVLYLVMGIIRVSLLTRSSAQWHDTRAQNILIQLQAANGIDSVVALLRCNQCVSPLTWGIRSHKILLPANVHTFDDALLRQMLSHELAHIQRKDWLCYILSRLAICLYWINPLVWLAHSKLVMESEKSCDDAAVDDTGCAVSYAENLLKLASRLSAHCTNPAPALFGNRSTLVQRIYHILEKGNKSHSNDRSCLVSGLLITSLLIAPFSAINLSFQVIERSIETSLGEHIVIPVHFIPNGTSEYSQLMHELGRV